MCTINLGCDSPQSPRCGKRYGIQTVMGSSDSSASNAELLKRAMAGELEAINRLLSNYRGRLKTMIEVHMDARLSSRLDASDVVQDALMIASQRIQTFQPTSIPFYVWLRQIARDRLSELYERNIGTQKRSVLREQNWGLSEDSEFRLFQKLAGSDAKAINDAIRSEMRLRLHRALEALPSHQREILVMRHLEQMTIAEIASACQLSEGAVKMRQLRAIQRLRDILQEESG